MEKLGKILLLILNIFIDIFLIFVVLILLLWSIFGITPEKSVQNTLIWIQNSWDSLWGIESSGRSTELSYRLQKPSHRNLYVAEPNQRDETSGDLITQPYK